MPSSPAPLRALLKGWLLSFCGWGLVGFTMSAYGVTTRGDSRKMHLEPSLRDWLPWAVLTPLLFRLVAWLPLERGRWKVGLPAYLVCCGAVPAGCHWWRANFARDPQRASGPDARRLEDRGSAPPDRWEPRSPGRSPGGPPRDEFREPSPGHFDGERPPPPPDGPFRRDWDRPPGPRPPGEFDMLRVLSFELAQPHATPRDHRPISKSSPSAGMAQAPWLPAALMRPRCCCSIFSSREWTVSPSSTRQAPRLLRP